MVRTGLVAPWDFDAPDQAFPVRLPPDLERKIMADNARALYRL